MKNSCFPLTILMFSLAAGIFLWSSCAGNPPAAIPIPEGPGPEFQPGGRSREGETGDFLQRPGPENLVFIPASIPALAPAPGVGNVTSERRDQGSLLGAHERTALTESFQNAYVDTLLRGQPLTGVLGSDQVHGWPENDPSGWVQNWQTADPRPNSWGIPSLILAVQSVEILREMAQDRVFTIQGEVLDHYGRSAGVNGANGDRGYGSPRGEEFFYNGSVAQRFELGLIIAGAQGKGSFLPGSPPSEGLIPPPEVGTFTPVPQTYSNKIRDAFLTAWKMALDRNIEAMVPDGSGIYLSFSGDPWGIPGTVKGLYIQTFNNRTSLLALPDTLGIPLHARFITSPFLDILLFSEEYPLPGNVLRPLEPSYSGGDRFTRRLMEGFALYGLPLSDPMPRRSGGDPAVWQEAQRFTRGWIAGSLRENE